MSDGCTADQHRELGELRALWQASIGVVLTRYGLSEGVLVVDDKDHPRAKRTRRIDRAHRIDDKKTDSYFNGQSILFLLLVTDKVTVPVGFCFAYPGPRQQAWRKENDRLKKLNIPKAERPRQPALELIKTFRSAHPQVTIRAVLADALYGSQSFMDQASTGWGGTQTISQLHTNQKVRFRGKARRSSKNEVVSACGSSHHVLPTKSINEKPTL